MQRSSRTQRSPRNQWLCLILTSCLALSGSSSFAQTQYRGAQAKGAQAGKRTTTPRPAPNQNRQSLPATKPAQQLAPQAIGKPTATLPPTAAAKNSARDASGKFTLRHRLQAGEIVRTRTVHVANTVTRIQGTEDVSESKTVSDKAWEVKEVSPEGLMTFEYRIDAVEMSQKQGDKEELTYNSQTDKEAPAIFSRVADTIAKPIAEVTIDGTGTVIERDKQSKTPPLGMGELAVPLPDEPVALGAQWSIPREVRVKLENGTQKVIKLREQYTLEKVSAGVATIGVKSQPLTPVEDSSVEAQLMQQMSEGVIKFDIDNGRLISKQLDWDDEVVGFRGAETSLKYVARFTEDALDDASEEPARAASASTDSSRK